MHDMSAHATQRTMRRPVLFGSTFSAWTTRSSGSSITGWPWLAALVGMVLSWLMRLHLGWTNFAIPGLHLLTKNGAPGNVMTPEFYLQLMTMHATIMVFFVLTTAPFAAFGNYFLPIQVGAEDMPFPHFNMMSFWVTFVAFPGSGVFVLRWQGTHPRRLDPVRPAERRGRGWRSRRRDRCGSLGAFHCHLLRWPIARLLELHHHYAGYADPGHEPVAVAAERLGLVHYFLHGPYGFRRVDASLHPPHPGPRCGNQLFRAEQYCH